jgi:hypothetical protein
MNKLDRLIRSAIKESMDEKAEELHSMIQDEDWNPNGPVTISAQPTDMSEGDEYDETSDDDLNDESCKYHMENFGKDDERTKRFCKGEMTETLHGGQKRLDKNKNNKLDAEDFKLLRKSKGKKEIDELDLSKLEKGGRYKYESPSFEDDLEYSDEVPDREGDSRMHLFRGKKAGGHLMGDRDVESFVSDFEDDLDFEEPEYEDVPLKKRRPVGDIEDI